MAISNIKATLQSSIQNVWNIVTSLENYQWRSDLSKIEIISDTQFIEYTKDGYATTFTITVSEPFKRWEFDMENSNMKGHWIGFTLISIVFHIVYAIVKHDSNKKTKNNV